MIRKKRIRLSAPGQAAFSSFQALVLLVVIAGAAVVVAVLLTGDHRGRSGSGLSPEFTYDIEKFRKVDPSLIRYKETATIETGLREVRGLAVGPDDSLYVAGDMTVLRFDTQGNLKGETALTDKPTCITLDRTGTLYIGFLRHVVVLNSEGKQLLRLEVPGSRAHLSSIAVNKDVIAVADAGNRVVLIYDRSGKLLRGIGKRDPSRNIPGLVIPSPYMDVAFAPDGLLRVANTGRHLIEAYTLEGDREFAWGKPGTNIDRFCGCCNPAHFAILPDGSFVTSEKGIVRVKIHEADGAFRCVVAPPSLFSEQNKGHDLAVDSKGRVLVLDPGKRAVRIFAPKSSAGRKEAGGPSQEGKTKEP